jgi:hypothetical protein
MIADWYKMFIQSFSKLKKGLAVTNSITPQIIRTSFFAPGQKSAPGSKKALPGAKKVLPGATMRSTLQSS